MLRGGVVLPPFVSHFRDLMAKELATSALLFRTSDCRDIEIVHE
jgi:hypothetical protein